MTERIKTIVLDESSIAHRTPEAEHERAVAMTDLLHENHFELVGLACGPYDVRLGEADGRLIFDVYSQTTDKHYKILLSIQPLRGIIRDYFLMCESYYEALKHSSKSKLEAIDMGRRGVHNDGAEALSEMLKGKIVIDFKTARRLFTLICVLHMK